MEFTATQLRQDSAKVFNEVQSNGHAKIVSRSRPDMVLLTQNKLDAILLAKYEEGKNEVLQG